MRPQSAYCFLSQYRMPKLTSSCVSLAHTRRLGNCRHWSWAKYDNTTVNVSPGIKHVSQALFHPELISLLDSKYYSLKTNCGLTHCHSTHSCIGTGMSLFKCVQITLL